MPKKSKVMRTPSGLIDGNFEWFSHNGYTYGIYQGAVIPFENVPTHIKDVFFAEFLADVSVKEHTEEKFKEWLLVNYGRLDHVPDLDVATGKTNNENVEKQYRLSPREIEVIKELSTGDPDKWTCERLSIRRETVRQHIKHISLKLNLHGKTAITRFAFEKSLI